MKGQYLEGRNGSSSWGSARRVLDATPTQPNPTHTVPAHTLTRRSHKRHRTGHSDPPAFTEHPTFPQQTIGPQSPQTVCIEASAASQERVTAGPYGLAPGGNGTGPFTENPVHTGEPLLRETSGSRKKCALLRLILFIG